MTRIRVTKLRKVRRLLLNHFRYLLEITRKKGVIYCPYILWPRFSLAEASPELHESIILAFGE